MIALKFLAALYVGGVLVRGLESLFSYVFATRIETVTRSREVKRDMREIKEMTRREMRSCFTWPLGILLLLIEKWKSRGVSDS